MKQQGVRKNALAGDRSGHGYRPRHSDNGQPAHSRSRGAAVQTILVAEVTVLAAAVSHAMGWRWPWRFRGARVCDEPSGFGRGRFEAHCLRSGLPPERLLRVLVGDTGASAALAFAEHSHEHSASSCNMRDCICRMGIGANAGPCAQGIDRLQAQFDSKLEANAAAGPSARESTAATMNRQPTPRSIAAAEAKLGEISHEKVQAFEAAIARARVADRIADPSACEHALADAQRVLDQL
jgi:hypothetical protein